MSQTDAEIIIINFSLNDAYFHEVPTLGMMAESPLTFQSLIRSMVTTAKSFGKKVILLEPNPVCKAPRQHVLQYYVAHLNLVAQSEKIAIVPHYYNIMAQPNWQGKLSDCVHPSDEMYRSKAEREFEILKTVIQSY